MASCLARFGLSRKTPSVQIALSRCAEGTYGKQVALVDDSPPRATPAAQAARWVSWVLSVAIGMTAPIILGAWIDGVLGSRPGLTLVGLALGMTLAGLKLWQLAKTGGTPTGGTVTGSPPTNRQQDADREPEQSG